MKKLSRKEEELLQIMWELDKGFVKEVIDHLPDPKPHYNTVATLMKRLEEKGYLGHKEYGGSYEYYPLIGKEAYRQTFMKKVLNTFFDNSYVNLLAYFAQQEKMDAKDVEQLLKKIEDDKKG